MQSQPSQDPYALGNPATWDDPYPTYARLREEAPVYFSHVLQGWILTRYQDVLAGFKDSRLSARRSASYAQAMPEEIQRKVAPVVRNLASWAFITDPPDHTRLRGLINKAFTPRMVENLRAGIHTLIESLLDGPAARGRMDVIAELANPLPVIVIGDMMGLPRADQHLLKSWSDGIANFLGASRKTPEILFECARGVGEMEAYLREVIADRRMRPGEDLISQLLVAEERGSILNEQELLSTCTMVLFGGHETSTHLIGNGLHALLSHPEQLEVLKQSPSMIPAAVEEIFRYDSAVQRQLRLAGEDLELGGQKVAKGTPVILQIGAANRDPAQFPDPDRLDVRRKEIRHLSMGYGTHYCAGAALGRMEAQSCISAMVRRFPGMKLSGEPLARVQNMTIRGFQALPILLG